MENANLQHMNIAELKAQREQMERQLASGTDILARRRMQEEEAQRAGERNALHAQLEMVLESASAPDEELRGLSAQSMASYMRSVHAIDAGTFDAVARCLSTLLDGEPSATVRLAAARTFQVFETVAARRAARLLEELSETAREELGANLSVAVAATPSSGRGFLTPSGGGGTLGSAGALCTPTVDDDGFRRPAPPSSGMSDCGAFRLPFAPASASRGRTSLGAMGSLE